MYLLDLPPELITLCCSHIAHRPADWEDGNGETHAQFITDQFRNLRLTCKRLSLIATKQLFSRLYILPTQGSARKARTVLDDERFNPLVQTIIIRASLDDGHDRKDDDPTPSWDVFDEDDPEWESDGATEQHGINLDGEISCTFKRLLDSIGLFRNFRRLELVYDEEVQGPPGDSRYWFDADSGGFDVKESMEYRDTFFRKVLSALNHADHPATKLDSLCIPNLQNWVNAEVATSQDFMAVLSRLDNLELYITCEQYSSAPEFEIDLYALHEFYSVQLTKYWLKPLSDIGRLTGLKLYGSLPWGYLPKCDLRDIHFPKLRNLSLGHMNFTHDYQLQWILSHADSLEMLALHNCSIVTRGELENNVDAENYPILPKLRQGTGRGRNVISTWGYGARWHEYFASFSSALPHLHSFAFTNDTWRNFYGVSSHSLESFSATEEDWRAEIRVSRYCMMEG